MTTRFISNHDRAPDDKTDEILNEICIGNELNLIPRYLEKYLDTQMIPDRINNAIIKSLQYDSQTTYLLYCDRTKIICYFLQLPNYIPEVFGYNFLTNPRVSSHVRDNIRYIILYKRFLIKEYVKRMNLPDLLHHILDPYS